MWEGLMTESKLGSMDRDASTEDDNRFDNNDMGDSKPDKKIRKRKRKLYQEIKSQMEFYFSDSNLRKDRFLSKLINNSEDSSVDLSIFLQFNKIRALTNNLQEIASALLKSELVQISENGMQIKRIKPILEKEDVDECTIYVEHLPPHADHSWITTVFNSFGTISYISLPRYKHTGKLKGFAFVEFETVDSAKRACKHFGSSFNSPSQEEQSLTFESESENLEKSSKRKREKSESEDDGTKRLKFNTKETPDASVVSTAEDDEEGNGASDKKHKKKRKRKKKQKVEEEEEPLNLRVMSKIEWKKWRNKYLGLQKAATAQIKKSLLGDGFETYKKLNQTCMQKDIVEDTEELQKTVKNLEFQPGVIVFVQLDQVPASISDFKKQARSLTNVSYIEAVEGDTSIYIRCADSSSAKTYVTSTRSGLKGTARILEGNEEKTYWDKIQRDRENKFLSKTKQKKRGIEKLMTKAEKIVEKSRHIRFEDD